MAHYTSSDKLYVLIKQIEWGQTEMTGSQINKYLQDFSYGNIVQHTISHWARHLECIPPLFSSL